MSVEYDKKELIAQLQDLAARLGRTPKTKAIQQDIYTADHSTFTRHFGSIMKARKKAGLKELKRRGNARKYTRKELLEKLHNFALALGRTPKMKEVDDNEDMPCASSYKYNFNNYTTACKQAGLQPNGAHKDGNLICKI